MWKEVLNFSLKNGGTLTATQANIWQGSLTIEQSVSADDTFELGSTHIGQMTVTLADLQVSQIQDATFSLSTEGHLILDGERVPYQTVYANVDFTDAVVVVYMAQDDDTLTQMGVYNVVQTTRDDGIISITAYDNMDKLSEVYTTPLTFPSTYGAMANEITGQLLTFDGSSTAVAEKPEAEDLTKREVLGYIAQACGYNVICNPQGYFQFVRYNLSGFSTQGQYHEISGLYSFHHSQYPVVITGVKVIVSDEEMTTDPDTGDTVAEIVTHEYTAGTDAYQLVIEENPLITTANGQSVADALYALYGNVEFYTGDVSHLSDLSIKASDIMKVTDRHNNTFPMLVSRTVISTGSAQSTSSYAEEPSRKITVQPSQMSRIQNSVKQAEVEAKNSKRIASNTNQYFWHTETGSDTGAHITEIPREDFLADPENGGGNTLIRSNGVAIRNGLTELAQFTSGNAMFYDGQGNDPENVSASFGRTGAVMGNVGGNRLEVNGIGMTGYDTDGSRAFDIQFANANNTARIVEKSSSITLPDSSSSQTVRITPNATLANLTTLKYTLNTTVNIMGENVVVSATFERLYERGHSETKTGTIYKTFIHNGGQKTLSLHYQYTYLSKFTEFSQWSVSGYSSTAVSVQVDTELTAVTSNVPSYTFGTRSNDPLDNGAYSFVTGEGLIASADDQAVVGKYNVADSNGDYAFIVGNGTDDSNRSNAFTVGTNGDIEASGAVKANAVQSFTPTWETGQEANLCHCVVSAGICSIFYQGPSTTHAVNTLLGTLPEGARPLTTVFCPFVKTGIAYGVIRIDTAGGIYVRFISSTTAKERIYFNCSYPVV